MENLDILTSIRDFCTHGICASACADTERFLMKGGWIQNTTKSGLSSAHQQNAIKWRFAGGAMITALIAL